LIQKGFEKIENACGREIIVDIGYSASRIPQWRLDPCLHEMSARYNIGM
jgi:hypothetical protein